MWPQGVADIRFEKTNGLLPNEAWTCKLQARSASLEAVRSTFDILLLLVCSELVIHLRLVVNVHLCFDFFDTSSTTMPVKNAPESCLRISMVIYIPMTP